MELMMIVALMEEDLVIEDLRRDAVMMAMAL